MENLEVVFENGMPMAEGIFVKVFSELYLDLLNEGFPPGSDKAQKSIIKICAQSMFAYKTIIDLWSCYDSKGNLKIKENEC